MASNGIKDRVAIVGMGCTPFGEHWDKGPEDLLVDAATQAQQSAGIEPDAVDAYYRSRKAAASRASDLVLSRRFASDGLYEAADAFLLEIRALVGAEAFAAAARDLYLASDFNRFRVGEKRIEDVFLAQAGADVREEVMGLFNRYIWGDNGERYRRLQELDAP